MKSVLMVLTAFFAVALHAASDDVYVVAETIYREAGGEGRVGIMAVATVIHNRSVRNGSDAMYECLRRRQFSFWNGRGRGERSWIVRSARKRSLSGSWEICLEAARAVVAKTFRPVGKMDHYYAHNKVRPSWAGKLRNRTVIGRHTFGVL